MKILYNDTKDDLYCVHCKDRIELGEKFGQSKEKVLGEVIKKEYHIDCIPTEDEDEINEALDDAADNNSDDME